LKEETSRLFKPEGGGEPTEPSKMPQRVKGLSFLNYHGLYESLGERYGGADVSRWYMASDRRSIAGKSAPVTSTDYVFGEGHAVFSWMLYF
jgi:hypothetical protein